LARNRHTRVVFPVFNGYEVRVICARDVAATGKRLREGDALADAEAGFVTRPERPGVGWLVFGLRPSPGTVAHECSHAVKALFDYVGAGPDEEATAYHLDYLVGRVSKFLKG
jgi:hypothetical protein